MGSLAENREYYAAYDWGLGGEEWSLPWGGARAVVRCGSVVCQTVFTNLRAGTRLPTGEMRAPKANVVAP